MNINLFQNLLFYLCVCRNAPVGFREAEERQFVRARGPPHFTDTGQGAPPETDGRPPFTPLHGMALLQKNLKVGVWWLKTNVIHTNNSCQNLCYLYLGHDFEKTHTLSALPKLYHCCCGVQNTTFKSHLQAKWRFEYLGICKLANWVEMLRARSRVRCRVRIL